MKQVNKMSFFPEIVNVYISLNFHLLKWKIYMFNKFVYKKELVARIKLSTQQNLQNPTKPSHVAFPRETSVHDMKIFLETDSSHESQRNYRH